MLKLELKVRELFSESSLNYKAERVSILDGTDEGVYEWVSYNHSFIILARPVSVV